jgi:hypothetical protein
LCYYCLRRRPSRERTLASDLDSALGQVNDALSGLTGSLAPARVFLAIAGLLITAALAAFNIVTIG